MKFKPGKSQPGEELPSDHSQEKAIFIVSLSVYD